MIRNRLKKIEKVLKPVEIKSEEAEMNSRIASMTTEEIEARIKELTCKALKMSADEYNSLTESERYCLHFEMHMFLEFLREGKTIDAALQKLKAIRPNYRKEIERYDAKWDE